MKEIEKISKNIDKNEKKEEAIKNFADILDNIGTLENKKRCYGKKYTKMH